MESPTTHPQQASPKEQSAAPHTWQRRVRRGLALVCAGFLAHELLEPHPPAPPAPQTSTNAPLEYLTPKEKRYRDALRSAFQSCTVRWPHILTGASLQPKGKIVFPTGSFPPIALQGEWQEQQQGASIALSLNSDGSLRSLREEAGDAMIELWPEQQSIHTVRTTREQREETWVTASDSLTSLRSHDGNVRSLLFEGESIDPATPVPFLLDKLQTPQRIFLFQQTFGTSETPVAKHRALAAIARAFSGNPHLANDDRILDLPAFFRTFRMNMKEWQEHGYRKGACNTYAEVACEALAHHGYPAHYLTYWPKGNKVDAWHTAAGFPTEKGWVIIDGTMDSLAFVPSPEAYGANIGMDLATVPIAGRLRWSRAPSPCARLFQLLHLPKRNKPHTAP